MQDILQGSYIIEHSNMVRTCWKRT